MARGKRYYTDEDDTGVTPSQLKRFGKVRQREYMDAWFRTYYEDPAQSTPHMSSEGGYLYIHGGPYDALDELSTEFGGIAREDAIEDLANDLNGESGDWAPTHQHADRQGEADEALYDDPDYDGPPYATLDEIVRRLASGIHPVIGGQAEQKQRDVILARIEDLEFRFGQILDSNSAKHIFPGIGHNQQPPVVLLPKAKYRVIREATSSIKREIQRDTPDTQILVNSTSKLQSVLVWMAKKSGQSCGQICRDDWDNGGSDRRGWSHGP